MSWSPCAAFRNGRAIPASCLRGPFWCLTTSPGISWPFWRGETGAAWEFHGSDGSAGAPWLSIHLCRCGLVIWNASSLHYKSARERRRRALMANAGMRGRPVARLVLSAQERLYLERQVRRHRVARSLSERCRVILRCADGLPSKDVAAELGLHEHTVGKWRRRFLKDRCDGLLEEARPGRPRTIDDDQVASVIERTFRTTPGDATPWSIPSMAGGKGVSPPTHPPV